MIRGRTLTKAALADGRSVAESHDLEIACDPALSEEEVLSLASATLRDLGVRTKRSGQVLRAVSHPWSVSGSPIFHWALLALIVLILVSTLQRSEGLMGVAVGQTKPDAPASYGRAPHGAAARLAQCAPEHPRRRLRAFSSRPGASTADRRRPSPSSTEPAGSSRRSASTPTSSSRPDRLAIYPEHLRALGHRLGPEHRRRRNRARHPAHRLLRHCAGRDCSRSLHGDLRPRGESRAECGSIGAAGRYGRTAREGAAWESDSPGRRDHDGRRAGLWIALVTPGEDVALPDGRNLRVDNVGYYARLQVVDDWSTVPLYLGMVAAMAGLTITAVARQQIVLATVVERPEGLLARRDRTLVAKRVDQPRRD